MSGTDAATEHRRNAEAHTDSALELLSVGRDTDRAAVYATLALAERVAALTESVLAIEVMS